MDGRKKLEGGGEPRHDAAGPTGQALAALVAELGSVSEACRRLGVDRSVYYRALRRTRSLGARSGRSPLAKPLFVESKLVAVCLEYPEWGCDRLAWYLTLEGDSISSPTAQKILIRHGLGRVAQRRAVAARLEDEGVRVAFGLTLAEDRRAVFAVLRGLAHDPRGPDAILAPVNFEAGRGHVQPRSRPLDVAHETGMDPDASGISREDRERRFPDLGDPEDPGDKRPAGRYG